MAEENTLANFLGDKVQNDLEEYLKRVNSNTPLIRLTIKSQAPFQKCRKFVISYKLHDK